MGSIILSHSFTRILSLCAISFLIAGVGAQELVKHDLKITFATPVSGAQAKFVHEGIRAQDPDPRVWLDIGTQSAIVRCLVVLDQSELQEAIAASGLVITRIREIGEGLPSMKSSSDVDEPRPRFVNTGDEAMDDLRYELAKRAWLEEHPEHDQQLPAAAPVK